MTNYPAPPDQVMRSKKEALAKAGLIDPSKVGRGRPPKEWDTWTEGLVALGWNIKGYSTTVSDTAAPKVVKEARRDPSAVLDVPDERRSESNWRATAPGKDSKAVKVGMRTVCANKGCNSSLTYCRCAVSTVWLDFDYKAQVDFHPVKEVKT